MFSASPLYSHRVCVPAGTQYLVKKCSNMLLRHIQKVLPELSADLNKLTAAKRKELTDIGEEDPRRSR